MTDSANVLEPAVARLMRAATDFADAVNAHPNVEVLDAAYAVVAHIRADRPDDREQAAQAEHDTGYRMLFAATILNALASELAPHVASHAEVIRRMIEAQGEDN